MAERKRGARSSEGAGRFAPELGDRVVLARRDKAVSASSKVSREPFDG